LPRLATLPSRVLKRDGREVPFDAGKIRSAIERAGLQDTSLRYTSDWEWIVRLSRVGPFVHVDRPLLRYRLSPGQLSGRTTKAGTALGILETAERIFAAVPELARRHGARVRESFREFHLDAAYALSGTRKGQALIHLTKSVAHGGHSAYAMKTALRIALPALALERLQRARLRGAGEALLDVAVDVGVRRRRPRAASWRR